MGAADDVLEDLTAHADATVAIGAGEEYAEGGAATLAVHGDGRIVVHQLENGAERETEGRLEPARVSELGRELARLGFTSLRARAGERQPGDVPVWVAIDLEGETLHRAQLWHGDRYDDSGLDGVLVLYRRLVDEVTGGELG